MLLLQFGESWQAFYVSGYISPSLFHGWFLSSSSPPPLFPYRWFLTHFFFFFPSTWLNHISFKASRQPWAQAAPGCVCGLESERISSWREWSLLFARHGPHPKHPSLVSFLWLILVSGLLPAPVTSSQRQAQIWHRFVKIRRILCQQRSSIWSTFCLCKLSPFSIVFCFSSFPCPSAVAPVEAAPTYLP